MELQLPLPIEVLLLTQKHLCWHRWTSSPDASIGLTPLHSLAHPMLCTSHTCADAVTRWHCKGLRGVQQVRTQRFEAQHDCAFSNWQCGSSVATMQGGHILGTADFDWSLLLFHLSPSLRLCDLKTLRKVSRDLRSACKSLKQEKWLLAAR